MTRPGPPRRDLRDRAAPRRLLGRGGRGARARRRLDARGRARGRARRGGQPLRPARRRRASGRARTSTPSRTAGASTGRSASSRRSRRPSGCPTRRSRSSRSAPRRRGCDGQPRARRRPAARRRSSSCTSSRARCSSALGEPLGIVTAIAGQARGEVVFEGRADHAGTTPMDARARRARRRRPRFVLHVRDAARDGTVATVGRDRGRAGRGQRRPGARDAVGRRPRRRRRRSSTRCRRDRLRADLARSSRSR